MHGELSVIRVGSRSGKRNELGSLIVGEFSESESAGVIVGGGGCDAKLDRNGGEARRSNLGDDRCGRAANRRFFKALAFPL
jgi:hypothetical protein